MAFYKTVIQVEVLTDGPYEFYNLDWLNHDITKGSASGHIETVGRKELTVDELISECGKHHTDPTFFTEFEEETFADRKEGD